MIPDSPPGWVSSKPLPPGWEVFPLPAPWNGIFENRGFPALASLFRERKYIPADPPALLEFPGAELLMIAVRRAVGREIGISLEEGRRGAEMVRDLRARRRDAPVEPLFEGEWV